MRPRGDCRRTCCRDLSQSADSAVNTAPTHHYTYTALTIRQQRLHRALEMKSVPICRYSPYRYILDNHVSAVARSCNYHARAIRHVRHLLTVDLAQTLACSLILSKIDYCNAVLHGAPSGTIQKLQPVQNNAARVVLQAPRRSHANSLLQELHWLPVEQRITYKLAVLTYRTRQTSVPEYLSRHITIRSSTRSLRSSSAPLLHVPFRRTSLGKRSFSTAAPSVWNSLPVSVQNCDTLTLFKSRLKVHLLSVYAS